MWFAYAENPIQEVPVQVLREIIGQSAPVTQATLSSVVIVLGLLLAGLSFLVTWAVGKPVLAWLRYKKFGKQVREDGPQSHLKKTGTPTMGGLMMLISIVLVACLFVLLPLFLISGGNGGRGVLLPIAVALGCGILGAVDDMLSLVAQKVAVVVPIPAGETKRERRKREALNRRGLRARFKMAWLLGISTVAGLVLYFPLELRKVYVPFVREPIELAGWIYIPIAILVISGSANAVNFTDGMDSLAAMTAAVAFGAYGIIGFIQLQPQVVMLAFTVSGACLGFLWYNAFPAQVFMGDTGSLMLGALLAVLAFQTNQWLLLPVIGGVFVAEALSVILQVSYFKWTKRRFGQGKRLLKMSPLHHHFELSGWSEPQTAMRFWLLSMVLALVGVAFALI